MEKSNFMEQALGDIAGLSIHWSSDCNMACKYCYIEKEKIPMATFNRKIREALGNKTFINNIKKVFSDTSRQQIIHLSLWGAEPTINAPYFKEFSAELLNYFPNVTEFMFSTNALLGADCLYNDFIVPLMTYAETH
jgi:sulfatase maturation enzyme AslB (radical SAM superfamily)